MAAAHLVTKSLMDVACRLTQMQKRHPKGVQAGVFYLCPRDGSAKMIVPVGPVHLCDWQRKLGEFAALIMKPNVWKPNKKNIDDGFILENGVQSIIDRLNRVSEATRRQIGNELSWRIVVIGPSPYVSDAVLLRLDKNMQSGGNEADSRGSMARVMVEVSNTH